MPKGMGYGKGKSATKRKNLGMKTASKPSKKRGKL